MYHFNCCQSINVCCNFELPPPFGTENRVDLIGTATATAAQLQVQCHATQTKLCKIPGSLITKQCCLGYVRMMRLMLQMICIQGLAKVNGRTKGTHDMNLPHPHLTQIFPGQWKSPFTGAHKLINLAGKINWNFGQPHVTDRIKSKIKRTIIAIITIITITTATGAAGHANNFHTLNKNNKQKRIAKHRRQKKRTQN